MRALDAPWERVSLAAEPWVFDVKRLAMGEVDIWVLRVGDLPWDLLSNPRRVGWLSESEMIRRERFRFQRDRDAFVAKRLLVRGALSQCAQVEPSAWQFTENGWGRPLVCPTMGVADLSFSVTQSGEAVVCAVSSTHLVGCDVEDTLGVKIEDMAMTILGDAETKRLEEMAHGDKREALYRAWTLKEAYVKARGMGLTMPVRDIQFDQDDRVQFSGVVDDDASGWRFTVFRLMNRYVAALAVGQDRLGRSGGRVVP